MPPYKEQFRAGSEVEIADKVFLEGFMNSWKFHHPLEPSQVAYAGCVATVHGVAFYHGGDPLYQLREIPGIWHEECLRPPQRANGILERS
jgi:hypothetical protein